MYIYVYLCIYMCMYVYLCIHMWIFLYFPIYWAGMVYIWGILNNHRDTNGDREKTPKSYPATQRQCEREVTGFSSFLNPRPKSNHFQILWARTFSPTELEPIFMHIMQENTHTRPTENWEK